MGGAFAASRPAGAPARRARRAVRSVRAAPAADAARKLREVLSVASVLRRPRRGRDRRADPRARAQLRRGRDRRERRDRAPRRGDPGVRRPRRGRGRWRARASSTASIRESAARLPLLGVPVAIKDVFDTAELPTEYGSPIYARPPAGRRRRRRVAAARGRGGRRRQDQDRRVRVHASRRHVQPARPVPDPGRLLERLRRRRRRAAGAARDRHPDGRVDRPARLLLRRPRAQADRPASCRSEGCCRPRRRSTPPGCSRAAVDDLELGLDAICAAPADRPTARSGRPLDGGGRVVRCHSAAHRVRPDRRGSSSSPRRASAIERYVERAAAAGAVIEEGELPTSFERLADAHLTIQRVETAWALGGEADRHGEEVSDELRDVHRGGTRDRSRGVPRRAATRRRAALALAGAHRRRRRGARAERARRAAGGTRVHRRSAALPSVPAARRARARRPRRLDARRAADRGADRGGRSAPTAACSPAHAGCSSGCRAPAPRPDDPGRPAWPE